ncbi:hypothetical protein T4C_616 [Trichinella pseudospiralis]|uniref:Uncharacterized protein n=1 Tax=Trichinella pseudospiralis TaxID=6337 RepID=A0A0V1GR26_TRIPS|nr:hypothetical protein T4C_616 [Trichinella pseudospiralis]
MRLVPSSGRRSTKSLRMHCSTTLECTIDLTMLDSKATASEACFSLICQQWKNPFGTTYVRWATDDPSKYCHCLFLLVVESIFVRNVYFVGKLIFLS